MPSKAIALHNDYIIPNTWTNHKPRTKFPKSIDRLEGIAVIDRSKMECAVGAEIIIEQSSLKLSFRLLKNAGVFQA